MPARTNEFQKLVTVINRHLGGDDVKITESAMLYDKEAETDREVDILVETTVINRQIKMGIECTARAAPVDITILQAFKEKHRNLGIHKTIVVSKNGFTESARSYGKNQHLDLLTFDDAETADWSDKFAALKGLMMYGRRYGLQAVNLSFTEAPQAFNYDVTTKVWYGEEWISLAEFTQHIFRASNISTIAFKELMENEKNGGTPTLQLNTQLSGVEFMDKDGNKVMPSGMQVVYEYTTRYESLSTAQTKYEDNDLVVGGFFNDKDGDFVHAAFTENDGVITGTIDVGERFIPEAPQQSES